MSAHEARWPDAPVIYQIYPRSFCDDSGDGVGDLKGIIGKLDHVADLGVDAIWLSPFYLSEWQDGGYDVVDHASVDRRLGTMADFDALVGRAHSLGLRVMIDQVLNHTSARHPWFLAALEGDEDCAERYLFRDAKADGSPPNNWRSQFGLPGWNWSHERSQYYFYQFLECQPSLNLLHPAVMAAHRDQMRMWRGHGVDGFRFDAITSFLWDEALRDNPPAQQRPPRAKGVAASPYAYQDHLYDLLPCDCGAYADHLRDWAGEDAYLIGEITAGVDAVAMAMEFTTPGRLDACYTTDLPESKADPATVCDIVDRADLQRIVGWMSSHDQPRHVEHGPDQAASAAVYALLMAFLPGPWLIYQGEEWGLPQPELMKTEITDPLDLLYWPDGPGREGARVPMPWNDVPPHFGFSDSKPWLPMRWIDQLSNRDATQKLYRDAIATRREREWGTGSIIDCRANDRQLVVSIEARGHAYRGVFSMGTADCAMADDALLTAGVGGSDWYAAIIVD